MWLKTLKPWGLEPRSTRSLNLTAIEPRDSIDAVTLPSFTNVNRIRNRETLPDPKGVIFNAQEIQCLLFPNFGKTKFWQKLPAF